MSRRAGRRRGSAFIFVLATVVGLVALLAGLASSQRTDIRAASARSQALRSKLLIDSAVARALAELSIIEEGAPTLLSDEWAQLGTQGDQDFVVGRDRFRMQIVDASSQIDLNAAPREQLERLPMTTEQIDSLLDWRTTETTPLAEGAKDDFYNALSTPYNTALRNFETLDEILLVRGFTAKRFYEPQTDVQTSVVLVSGSQDEQPSLSDLFLIHTGGPNLNDQGAAKTDANTGNIQVPGIPPAVALAIQGARPITTYSQMLNLPGVNTQVAEAILNNLAPNANPRQAGKINLNTATEAVLNSVPEMPADAAQSILSRQSTGFTALGELTSIPGLTGPALAAVADYFLVHSDTYLVRVLAQVGGKRTAAEILVRVEGGLPRVLQRWTPPDEDPRIRWNWQDETTSEVVLKEDSQ